MKLAKLLFASTFLFLLSCESDPGLSNLEIIDTNTKSAYANMLVVDNFMYVIDNENIQTFSLATIDKPELLDEQFLGFNMESLLHYKGNLFIGSSQAMYIYEINQNGIPSETSVTEYQLFGDEFCANDPIAANDQNAYASLSTSVLTQCTRVNLNEIQVFNIEDLSNPEILASVEMDSPRGIALDGNLLFVTEADTGLKVLDVTVPKYPKQLYHFDGFRAFDVIANNGLLVVVGPEKIYEYDYSNIDHMVYLSEIDF